MRRPAQLSVLAVMVVGLVATAVSLVACSKSDTAVPREHAYPRIALYDTVYRVVRVSSVSFEVNADAALDTRSTACDIHYPRYNATIYVGVAAVKPDSIAAHRANRLQRMALNLDGVPAHYGDVEASEGSLARLVIADGLSATPVQALYADTVNGIVVSAAAFMHDGTLMQRGPAAVDSLRPVTEALTADMIRLLRTIRPFRR